MADNSLIEWTDSTWNIITGCSVVSPGCTNCYAMKLAGTRLAHHPSREGLTIDTKGGPVWNGQVRFNKQWLTRPLQWKRPRMIFVCAHGDLFHESVPDEWIDKAFAVMALAPQHVFQVLTKRSKRMREYMNERWQPARAHKIDLGDDGALDVPAETVGEDRRSQIERECEPLLDQFGMVDTENDSLWTEDGKCKAMQWQWPLPNVWLGVSTEDQQRADERVPDLRATPAAVRWVSYEPALGPIDFDELFFGRVVVRLPTNRAPPTQPISSADTLGDVIRTLGGTIAPMEGDIDWLVCGGESGQGARPMHPAWARSARDQCAAAGVPFFFKQHGNWLHMPERAHLRDFAREPWDRVASKISEVRPALMFNVGKKAAGRLLDGIEHNGMPGDPR
jgi:protein gp37